MAFCLILLSWSGVGTLLDLQKIFIINYLHSAVVSKYMKGSLMLDSFHVLTKINNVLVSGMVIFHLVDLLRQMHSTAGLL